jgi:hypothetical protein
MNPLHTPFQPQAILTARFADFPRRRSYGYASSRESPNRTRQDSFRLTDGDVQWVQ